MFGGGTEFQCSATVSHRVLHLGKKEHGQQANTRNNCSLPVDQAFVIEAVRMLAEFDGGGDTQIFMFPEDVSDRKLQLSA